MLNLIKKQQQPGMSSLNAKQEAELKELKTFIDKETLTMTPKQHLELQKMEHQQHKLSEKESK